MIISASRRTDIPAFYPDWFVNRVRAGCCLVPNPRDPRRVARVSLRPEDVDAIVFWTRNPHPLFRHLADLDRLGFFYYFQFTLMGNPRWLDPRAPRPPVALDVFRTLSEKVGPDRIVWRYDPIVLSAQTGPAFHVDTFGRLAYALRGCARRCVISVVDVYRRTRSRLKALESDGSALLPWDPEVGGDMIRAMANEAGRNRMEITSCAEPLDLSPYGVRPGSCVDGELIRGLGGRGATSRKDPSQRKACGCVESRDIGMYDTCLFGCRYCYATGSEEAARARFKAHEPEGESLVAPPMSRAEPAMCRRRREGAWTGYPG